MRLRRKDEMIVVLNNSLIDLPSPSNLRYFWNFGSLLGIFLFFQIFSGLFLSFHFRGDVTLSFDRVIQTIRDVNYGWFMRVIHANGARMFFLLMYIHIGRGLYYGSYRYYKVWLRGVRIMLLSMATAFLGYVLPWGQMSFWAATVITNLLSAIPYVGVMLVEWIWGGFAVGNPTLVRFFAFHFILPLVILVVVVIHLLFLHEKGSSNSVGLRRISDRIFFHPYYRVRDVFGLVVFIIVFMVICLWSPYLFIDVENFIPSNPLVTPVHIQPEWYFLFAYCVLRSVPRKIGGVVALIMSVIVLYFLPIYMRHRFCKVVFYGFMNVFFWAFVVNWMMLTWIGACEVDRPYRILGIHFSVLYFLIYVMFWFVNRFQDHIV